MKAPVTEKKEKELTIHGDTRIDPYFWLRDKDSPEVKAHIAQENEYTTHRLNDFVGLKNDIYEEILRHKVEEDESAPSFYGDYEYFSRTKKGLDYRIYYRRHKETREEEILFDTNKESEGHDYFWVRDLDPSPNHKRVAAAIDFEGDEVYDIWIKDLESGQIIDKVPDIVLSFAWSSDSSAIFYCRYEDKTLRSHQVWKHTVGDDRENDVLIFEEKDDLFQVNLNTTADGKYVIISSGGHESRHIVLLNEEGELKEFIPRKEGVENYVDCCENKLFYLTDDDAPNFKIMMYDIADDRIEEVLGNDDEILREEIHCFKNHLITLERKDGLQHIRILNLLTTEEHFYSPDLPIYELELGDNFDFDTNLMHLSYESMALPMIDINYNLDTKEITTLKEKQAAPEFNKDDYQYERLFAPSRDGKTQIPISLVYRKDSREPGRPQPLVLNGYGSYGLSHEVWFRPSDMPLLDRGYIVAVAHIRGGSEMGRKWYKDGKMANKMNTFYDFIDCCECLHDREYSIPELTVIKGGSAGGLLMGVVINLRPDLFGMVATRVPFVDVLNTMLDKELPLTIGEYVEWGNPHLINDYWRMKEYSPYDNIKYQDYPEIFVRTGVNDSGVGVWEPMKWVAKLRDYTTSGKDIVIRIEDSGHSGAASRYKYIDEVAEENAFVVNYLERTKEE